METGRPFPEASPLQPVNRVWNPEPDIVELVTLAYAVEPLSYQAESAVEPYCELIVK